MIYFDDDDDDYLEHYGTPKRSGRYPWGSGDEPYQRSGDFLSRVEALKKAKATYYDEETGKTYSGDTAIAKIMKLPRNELQTQMTLAKEERKRLLYDTASGLQKKGYSLNQIAEQMGYANDSSVRNVLKYKNNPNLELSRATADILRKEVDAKGIIDVGPGVALELGVTDKKLKDAIYLLEREGYQTFRGRMPQVTNPGRLTTLNTLCTPDKEHKDIFNYENVHSVKNYVSHDGGETFDPKWVYPKSLDSKRVAVRYAEEGGLQKDGLVEIRRNVKDVSLGNSKYAQVRILVDDKKYIKGMAVYSDDLPDGIDVMFNTNKPKSIPKMEVFKDIKKDPDNPFGSLIKQGVNDPDKPNSDAYKGGQSYYYDDNNKKQLSVINKRAEEGDWNDWSVKLSPQFLAKQNKSLVTKQLKMTKEDKQLEFNEISSYTNPTIKRQMLSDFAEDCDAAAVHLKAASLPRQSNKVILPVTTLKDNEIYAPGYKDGEQLALIRYPHAGLFEIPILTVNNKNQQAKSFMKNAPDAVGINSKNAEILSGADFDGDSVMIIPTNSKVKISNSKPFEGLVNFDPKYEYGATSTKKEMVYDKKTNEDIEVTKYYRNNKEFKPMNNTQNEMGRISNLITDMTIKGAVESELTRAVKHSMVVIDAEKHKLDYSQSFIDNDIASLKKKYQGSYDENTGKYHEGSATLLSRAKSKQDVLKRKGSPIIDPETGKVSYKEVYEEYVDKKTGKTKVRMQESTKMAETDDARTLSTGHPIEELYADYANSMKALANQARKEMKATPNLVYSASANKEYKNEANSLNHKLNISLKNAPKERAAQSIANTTVTAKRQANPDMTNGEKKKISQQALTAARTSVNAKREPIKITDREWEAIQAGAISDSKLASIIKYVDGEELRQRAMPRTTSTVSPARMSKINAMLNSDYSLAEIAGANGISTTTLNKYIKERNID